MNSLLLDDPAHRRRVIDFQRRPLPELKAYSPRLRRDQIKAVYPQAVPGAADDEAGRRWWTATSSRLASRR